MSNPTTTYLSTGEVVAYLAERGITVKRMTVQRWARAGKVRAKRLTTGGQFLFLPEDIDALIADAQPVAVA